MQSQYRNPQYRSKYQNVAYPHKVRESSPSNFTSSSLISLAINQLLRWISRGIRFVNQRRLVDTEAHCLAAHLGDLASLKHGWKRCASSSIDLVHICCNEQFPSECQIFWFHVGPRHSSLLVPNNRWCPHQGGGTSDNKGTGPQVWPASQAIEPDPEWQSTVVWIPSRCRRDQGWW